MSVRPGLFAAGAQLVIWVLLVLLAWPDQLVLLTNPFVATFVSFGVAGMLLVVRRPQHAVGRLMLIFGISASVGIVGPLIATRLIAAGAPMAGAWSDAIGNAVMTAAIVTVPAILILFPDGVIAGRWGRILLGITGLVALLGAAAALLNGGWGGDPRQAIIPSPLRSRTAPLGDVVANFFFGGLALSVVGASASLLSRWRRSTGLQRQQIKWLAVSAALVVICLAATGFNTSEQWEIIVVAGALASIPVAIVAAVLRYRLYDIDRLISRTLGYAVVAGLLGLVFLGLVASFTFVLPSDDPLVVAVATLAVAALFNPLRRRVQRFVDRRFNRSRYDTERVIERFSGRLQEHADPEWVVDGWVGVVEEIMEPEIVGVWVKRGRR